MLYSLLVLSLGTALSEAAVVRTSGCQLHLTASGAISGAVGEISSGQVRAGSGVSSTSFTLRGGQLWDNKGHGCWWTRKFFLSLCSFLRFCLASCFFETCIMLMHIRDATCDSKHVLDFESESWFCMLTMANQHLHMCSSATRTRIQTMDSKLDVTALSRITDRRSFGSARRERAASITSI
jgi:hypothetical protein